MDKSLIGTWEVLRSTTYGEWTERPISVKVGQTFRVIEVSGGNIVTIRKGHTTTETTPGTIELSAKKVTS